MKSSLSWQHFVLQVFSFHRRRKRSFDWPNSLLHFNFAIRRCAFFSRRDIEPGPYLGCFVCGGKLRLRGQTPQTFTGISRIQTGFLVKHYVRKKKLVFLAGATAPPAPPLCTAMRPYQNFRAMSHLISPRCPQPDRVSI